MKKSALSVLSLAVLATVSFNASAQTPTTTQVMSGSNPRPQVMSGSNPRPQVMSGSNPSPCQLYKCASSTSQVMSGSNPRPQVSISPLGTAFSTVLSLLGVYNF